MTKTIEELGEMCKEPTEYMIENEIKLDTSFMDYQKEVNRTSSITMGYWDESNKFTPEKGELSQISFQRHDDQGFWRFQVFSYVGKSWVDDVVMVFEHDWDRDKEPSEPTISTLEHLAWIFEIQVQDILDMFVELEWSGNSRAHHSYTHHIY